MTADQLRRTIRAELHAARCRGKDHSEERYFNDARELDRRMAEAGYELPHPTTWSAQYAQRLKGAISLNVIDDHPLGDAELNQSTNPAKAIPPRPTLRRSNTNV